MRDSLFKTATLPTAVAGSDPLSIANGTDVPRRVLVRNVSAALVFLAGASQDIVGPGGVGANAYRLAPGEADVFVLAPKQQLFAAALGVGAIVSVASSDALPLV
jgi:hypothetical protein